MKNIKINAGVLTRSDKVHCGGIKKKMIKYYKIVYAEQKFLK